MNSLEKYLNEHLAGSGAALKLLTNLARSNPLHRPSYESLHEGILRNRQTLRLLIEQAGFKRSKTMEITARCGASLAILRLKYHGMENGRLGLVEALEALELGIQGQMLLWNGLTMLTPALPQWKETDFNALRKRAEEQRTTVEILRLEAAHAAFFEFPLPSH